MTMTTAFSLAPLFRHSVGFDRFNDLFESAARNEAGSSYPPYNVEKHGDDHYRIVVAAAGFQEEDLDLQVEKGVLTVTGGKRDNGATEVTYLHQGIAQRVPPGRPYRSQGRRSGQWPAQHRPAAHRA
jgi:molecular chaperone IbpA